MTRTVYFGNQPIEKYLEIYNTILEVQLKAIDAVKVGVSNRELDKIPKDDIASKGSGEIFGHGIGLEIHELPNVSRKSEDFILEENMIISIEPGIYIEGFGGVRIKDGHEILNKTTKELIIIK